MFSLADLKLRSSQAFSNVRTFHWIRPVQRRHPLRRPRLPDGPAPDYRASHRMDTLCFIGGPDSRWHGARRQVPRCRYCPTVELDSGLLALHLPEIGISRRAKWPSGDTESKALLETIVIDVATEAVRLYTESQESPLWTCGLFVVVSGGKYRCIHDARPINEHLPDGSVSYEEFSSSLNPEMRYALKTDIWSAFKQIPVSEADTPKLGFSVGEVLGAYRTLPLGLRQSPKRFCAAISPVILAARALGVYCVWYVDDVLILGRTPREAVDGIMIFHQLLKRVGLLLAPNKFVPILATRISFQAYRLLL